MIRCFQVKLRLNVSAISFEMTQNNTNPEQIQTPRQASGARDAGEFPQASLPRARRRTQLPALHPAGNSVPEPTSAELKLFLLDNWKKTSSLSSVSNKRGKSFDNNSKKQ